MFIPFFPLAVINKITEDDVRAKAKELKLELSEGEIRQYVENQLLPELLLSEKDVRARAKELGVSLTDVQVRIHVEKQTLPEKPAPVAKAPEYETKIGVDPRESEDLQKRGWIVTRVYHQSGLLRHDLQKVKS